MSLCVRRNESAAPRTVPNRVSCSGSPLPQGTQLGAQYPPRRECRCCDRLMEQIQVNPSGLVGPGSMNAAIGAARMVHAKRIAKENEDLMTPPKPLSGIGIDRSGDVASRARSPLEPLQQSPFSATRIREHPLLITPVS
jgi:hypothetical protein